MKIIVVSLCLTILATLTIEYFFNNQLNVFFILLIYFGFYGVLKLARTTSESEKFSDDTPIDRSNWPLPGPFSKSGNTIGAILFMAVFWTTHLLSFLNPFQFKQLIRQMIGLTKLEKRLRKNSNDYTSYQTKANYCLPFRGEWLVYNGGYTPKTSHSWDIYGQRFALDFVQADDNFQRHSGSGTSLNQYYCYGKEILAASSGKVLRVEERISDAPFVGFGFCDFTARSFIGNYVMIEHHDDEYGLYAHLIKGSVCVKPGDMVKQGQIIGRCGHSGHSSEPHLHFHLQDSPEIFEGMGLPVQFNSVKIENELISDCYVMAGQKVHNNCHQK
jgi:hypothetical protein